VGDLYVKVGNVTAAVDMYERAVTKYTEGGFYNNAIALCNKVLRNAPGRTHMYLKLAQLMVHRGFVAEAKQNLLEYADRMRNAGKLDEAFRALKEFADLSPNNEEIRLVLAEQLKAAARTDEAREQLAKLYHETKAAGDVRRSRATIEKMKAIDPEYDVEAAPKPKIKPKQEKSSDLVFLDLGEDVSAPVAPPPPPPRPAARPAPAAPKAAPPPAPVPPPEPEEIEEAAAPEPLEFEPTSLVEAAPGREPAAEPKPAEVDELPVERASIEFDAAGIPSGTMEGLTGTGVEAPEAPPLLDLEPTILEPPPVEEAGEETPGPELPLIQPEFVEDVGGKAEEALPLLEEAPAAEAALPELEAEPEVEAGLEAEEEAVGAGGTAEIEAPELDLGEPQAQAPSLDVDLDVGEIEFDIEIPESALEAAVAGPPDVASLEALVAADPDDPLKHHQLAEALIETGERERGMQELNIALQGYEAAEDWRRAEDLADEILRLDPGSVQHYQKKVEYAFRSGEKSHLVDAYLELSDALFRSGALERARAVYQRVLELDPENDRARSALVTLEPPAPPAPGPPSKAAPAPAAKGDFVDLGALILEEEPAWAKGDARMRIQDEEPTGDEQRDFDEMLAQFKKGIEATLGVEDVQAHYDLGIAFKEMGLLDEAIGEFQKALRGSERRLRTSEALGTCFFEKGQYSVAATVMRRAIESDPGGDDEKIGLLYWVGRCEEELGRPSEALVCYQRVFAVDIGFQDVRERVKSLSQARR
jgi:tetratricopeptide (TPR) repeat protein